MSDDEVDELLKAVDTSSGEINYTGSSSVCLLSGSVTNLMYQISSGPSWPTDDYTIPDHVPRSYDALLVLMDINLVGV